MSKAKKQLKKAVNETGAFLQIPFSVVETNAVDTQVAAQMPDDCFLFKGIASTEDLNRNDYIIRESAWVNALPGYMQNPIILFQHEPKEAIGNTIDARVTENGLEVVGYIRRIADSTYAAGNIEAGVYRALSTGHLTTNFEFENSTTGQIISRDEFKTMAEENGWFGKWADEWKMAVTELEFVEWSVVSIPANSAALRTSQKEILKNFYQINDSTPDPETDPESEPENEGETPEAEEAKEEVMPLTPGETPDAPVATPPEAEPVATQEEVKDEVVSTNSFEVKETPPVDVNETKTDAVQPPQVDYMELIETQSKQIVTMAQALVDMQNEFGTVRQSFEALKRVVDQIPNKRGLIAMSQFAEVKKPVENAGAKQLKNLFGRVGVDLKD